MVQPCWVDTEQKAPSSIRVATLNVAHGRRSSFNMWQMRPALLKYNLDAIVRSLEPYAIDVLALQEADQQNPMMPSQCQIQWIAQKLGFPYLQKGSHTHFPGRLPIHYGTALLSKFPLDIHLDHRFAKNWRDNKGMVISRVTVEADTPKPTTPEFDVVSLHLDFLNSTTRGAQIQDVVDILKARQRPVVITGDFNCHRASVQELMTALNLDTVGDSNTDGLATFPANQPKRRIDWILASKSFQFHSYVVAPTVVSDHRMVVADLGYGQAA